MASLVRLPGGLKNRGNRGRTGKYYARIYIPRPGQNSRARIIPLKTENLREAAIRLTEVERVEHLLKQEIEHIFPWISGSPTAVKQTRLSEGIENYLKEREIEGLCPKTLDAYRLGLTHFASVVGRQIPIENLTANNIQSFIQTFRKRHTATTLNINLRSIKTFLNWAKESALIKDVPKIKEVRTGTGLPRYLSTSEFDALQKEATTPFLADVFWFYRETGCRLREPFNADLKGSFLLVATKNSKGREERQIPLNPDLILIYEKLIGAGHDPVYYSSKFKDILRSIELEGHKFHDLRHTFGIRTWLQTGDLHLVSQLMGHKSILTTQIYTKFFIARLREDFPDLTGFAANTTIGRFELINRGSQPDHHSNTI